MGIDVEGRIGTNNNIYDNISWTVTNTQNGSVRLQSAFPGVTLSNNRIVDPVFVNPTSRDYHLQSASPARDTGSTPALPYDFEQRARPQGAGPDLGAYER